MASIKIPYQQTGYFSKTICEYLDGEPALSEFYQYAPEIESFKNAITDKSKEILDRDLLSNTIASQYGGLRKSALVDEQIQLFRKENTYCIVTAHQLNIFTGPLYVIYKTISAIALCKRLAAAYPAYNFIPVFWLGSEDHDFTEIAHFHLFGKKYEWQADQGGACGRMEPSTLKSIMDELRPVLGEGEHAQELMRIFSAAYLEQPTLAAASRYILNELFGQYGLVVVDGDDKVFKQQCSSIVADELFHQSAEQLVNATIEKFPHEPQAKPRNINLFYLQHHLRERIVFDAAANKYQVLNTQFEFSREEMEYQIIENIQAFSPNVILRPLFQQKVLPSLAYIGGGGEIAYWLLLRSVFDHYQIALPVLLLRDSFLLVDAIQSKKINKLGLTPEHFFKNENDLIGVYVKSHVSENISLQNESNSVQHIMDSIAERAARIDASLDKSVLAEKQNFIHALARLEAKLLKAEKSKMEAELNQIKTVRGKLFPMDSLQERHENFIAWYLKSGSAFFDSLLAAAMQPTDGFTILTDEN